MGRRANIIVPNTGKMITAIRNAVYAEYNEIRKEVLVAVKKEWANVSIKDRLLNPDFDREYYGLIGQSIRATYTNDPKSKVWSSIVGVPKNNPYSPLSIWYEWGTGIDADPSNPYYDPSSDPYRNPGRGGAINAPIVGRPGISLGTAISKKGNPYTVRGLLGYTQMGSPAFIRYSKGGYFPGGPHSAGKDWDRFYRYIGGRGMMPQHWLRKAIATYLSDNNLHDRFMKRVREAAVVSKYVEVRSYKSSV